MNEPNQKTKKVASPTVTVLMAVYNGEEFINSTIDSILNQTFTNFEFIIVNDASTDSTRSILESYKDPRIILHHNERNLGQTKSLNVGLKLATGKYVARIDAGDVSLSERLKRQVAFVENNSGISVLGTSAFRYNSNGKIIDVVHMPMSPKVILQRIFFASPVVHISALINRKAILHLEGYDEDFDVLADYELWSKLLKSGYRISNLKQILVGYMISPDSLGSKNILGKSYTEACKITQSNVRRFTDLTISLEQAGNIHKFFNLDMYKMPIEDISETEELFIRILTQIGASRNDMNYFLIRKYVSHVFHNIGKPGDTLKFKYSISSIFQKRRCIFSLSRLSDSLLRFCQSLIWRTKRQAIKFNF